jgi:hypothetical protein
VSRRMSLTRGRIPISYNPAFLRYLEASEESRGDQSGQAALTRGRLASLLNNGPAEDRCFFSRGVNRDCAFEPTSMRRAMQNGGLLPSDPSSYPQSQARLLSVRLRLSA